MNQQLQRVVQQGGGKLTKHITAALLAAWTRPVDPMGFGVGRYGS